MQQSRLRAILAVIALLLVTLVLAVTGTRFGGGGGSLGDDSPSFDVHFGW